jgi:hypothetical protein
MITAEGKPVKKKFETQDSTVTALLQLAVYYKCCLLLVV